MEEDKKILMIIGMEKQLEQTICRAANIQPENALVLKSVFPDISQPYGDLMRDIITLVHRNKAEEIWIVRDKHEQTADEDISDLLNRNKDLSDRMQTLEYLFQNCSPEFTQSSIDEWLSPSKNAAEGVHKSVAAIRRHPLIPSHVKVKGFLIENSVLTEIEALNKNGAR
ncbi:carbonic anhydrase [Bacillus sp. GM2]|uniref:carbonic anhydrase n=1 Tax=Bacillus TaxID=1386 RepID=UPI000952044D|nr:carbonic anhydrase [Bacillus paralicheniformis]MSO00521.1 carbonic anhydrase [Bacillus paralicheniformis]MSO04529.1 carbonic anhydrase [Bacillus paralicheniformis]MSO08522.1 carbonic anhydrase [Bacillus paralicheniformis]MSO12516.1 carbonic anhydrase [Bacillus paralicheniformis]NJE39173.1 carbonic anhydrase [Bacillus paralicheniformis]